MSRRTMWTLTSAAALAATLWSAEAQSEATQPTLSMQTVKAGSAEDGTGRSIDARSPVALELRAPAGWPARALDPVLHIGDLHFHSYTHTDRHTIRFLASDAALFHEGMAVYVQYGDDASSRVQLEAIGRSR